MPPRVPDLPGPLRRLPVRWPGGRDDGSGPQRVLLELDLTRALAEQPPGNPLEALRQRHTPLLRTLVERLHRAADDDDVVGLAANLGDGPSLTLAQSGELRAAVMAFRASGRPTLAWAMALGEFGVGTIGYHLATAFEQVWLQPSGAVGLTGFSARGLHLRGLLDRLDVEPQIRQRHEYKSAADTFVRTELSEPVREMLSRLVISATQIVVADVARDRGLTADAVLALLEQAPLSADRAVAAGLVDRLGYRDEAYTSITDRAASGDGPRPVLRFVERHGPGRLESALETATGSTRDAVRDRIRAIGPGGERGAGRPLVAVVQASGAIVPIRPSGPGPSSLVTADRLGAVLRAAGREDRVRAVVLRIDSPGGSYVASDAIRHEVLALRAAGIPVVASMASVAASGGYFIAMGCDRVVANPGTITGSIGVLAGKQVVRRALERIGVGAQPVPAVAHADMFSALVPFDDEELARLDTWLDAVYDDFTTKAAHDRGLDVEALRAVARGRVWSGADAVERGLVDTLGGLHDAVDAACVAAGLARADVEVKPFPSTNAVSSLRSARNSDDVGTDAAVTLGPGAGLVAGLLAGREGPPLWTAALAGLTGVITGTDPFAAGGLAVLGTGPGAGLGVLSLPPVGLPGLLPGH